MQYSGVAVPVGEDAWVAGKPIGNSAVADALKGVPSPAHGPMPYVLTATYTDIAGRQKQRLELGVGTKERDQHAARAPNQARLSRRLVWGTRRGSRFVELPARSAEDCLRCAALRASR